MKSSSSSAKGSSFHAVDPRTGEICGEEYFDARLRDIDLALDGAAESARALRDAGGGEIEKLLASIGAALGAAEEGVCASCLQETGYPEERVRGEFQRMVAAMGMFGAAAAGGDWLNVRIDHGDPERKPLPKPDLRCMDVPLGPVVVFGASNFPLALSVAGSDVASALAARCPVVTKGHPSHPATSAALAAAVSSGVEAAGFPAGVYSMVQGVSKVVGQALVEHPETRAVAFTGSLAGGRAIFDLAAQREVPIPVYAEMGSVNPQFVFPDLLQNDAAGFADRLLAAATMGNGQFCTNPGLVFVCGAVDSLYAACRQRVRETPACPMLNHGILRAFVAGVDKWRALPGVEILEEVPAETGGALIAGPAVARVALEDFQGSSAVFQEEVFGPATLLIECGSTADYLKAAKWFAGQLGASIHGSEADLSGDPTAAELLAQLGEFSGRVLVNQFPTGLEACASLQHGGPYPATTDSHWTSVGTAAISRFGRPLAFQNVPDPMLPDALKESNPLGLRRLVDGAYEQGIS